MNNPFSLAEDVQLIALAHPDPAVRVELALRRDQSPSTLERLSIDSDSWVRMNVAANPRTSTSLLRKLFEDPDLWTHRAAVRQAKARGLPVQQSERTHAVAEARSHATSGNRQVDLAANGDLVTRLHLARNTALCLEAQRLLALTPDSRVRAFFGRRPHIHPEVIELLANVTGDHGAQVAIARNRKLPSNLLAQLVSHPSYLVRQELAEHHDLDDTAMVLLANDRSRTVRLALARNPRTPTNHLLALAHHRDRITRLWIINHRRVTPEVMAVMAHDPSVSVRYAMARRIKKLDSATKRVLALDTSFHIRLLVATDAKADPQVLDLLALGKGCDGMVSRHTRLSQATLRRFLDHPSSICRLQAFLRLDSLTAAELSQGVADPSWQVRETIAGRADAHATHIDTLSHDRNNNVRGVAARHEEISMLRLDQLASDPNKHVRQIVARNPRTTTATLAKITCEYCLSHIAAHPNVGAEQLRVLAFNRDRRVRMNAARNPNLDIETMYRLARSRKARITSELVRNQSTPPKLLAELADSEDFSVRMFIAENPNTPAETLAALANDGDEHIRRIAARNPSTPAAERVLAALA